MRGPARAAQRTRVTLAILTVGTLTALAGCASAPPPSSPDPQLLGTWHLVVATERGATIKSGAEEITLTIGDSDHTGGSSPCSFYRASVTGGVGAVYIDAYILGRGADCSDAALLHIDDQYIAALSATTVANIDGGNLVLSSPSSSLVFIKPVATSSGTLQNSRWSLVEPPNLRAPTAVTLTFGRANEFTVTTPCSISVASYVLVEDVITVRAVSMRSRGTKACTPTDRVIQADVTGQLTADVSSATIAGPASLILTNRANEEPLLWLAN